MEHASLLAETLESWTDFYLLAGTAAVTLMGLLFVALSMHLDVIAHADGRHLKALALEAFMNLLFALFISLFLLTPHPMPRPTGMALAFLGVFRAVHLLRASRVAATAGHQALRRNYSMVRFLLPVVAYGMLIVAGTLLFLRPERPDPIALLAPTLLLMIVSATRGAWDLLVRVAELKQERAAADRDAS